MKTLNEYFLCKTISSIDEYLLSKTNPKAATFQDEFCLVLAWGPLYDELCDEWGDALVTSDAGEPSLFLLRKTDAKEYYKKAASTDITVYEIPEQYTSLEEFDKFEDDYNNGKIGIGDGIEKEVRF